MSSIVPFPLISRLSSAAIAAERKPLKPLKPSLTEQEQALRKWVDSMIDSHGKAHAAALLDTALARLRIMDR